MHRRQVVALTARTENERREFLPDLAVLGVLDDPDDLEVERPPAGRHASADGLATQVELFGKRFVDDDHALCAGGISRRELPSGHERILTVRK